MLLHVVDSSPLSPEASSLRWSFGRRRRLRQSVLYSSYSNVDLAFRGGLGRRVRQAMRAGKRSAPVRESQPSSQVSQVRNGRQFPIQTTSISIFIGRNGFQLRVVADVLTFEVLLYDAFRTSVGRRANQEI
jgi:hypothetical protein